MKISNGIKEVEKSAPTVVNILAYIGIGTLVLGVITGIVADGTITVTGSNVSGILFFLNSTLGTSSVTVMTSLITVVTTIVSLIIVAVLWKFFGLGKKNKGNSM